MDWLRIYPFLLQFGVGGVMCAVGVWCGYSSGYLVPGDRNAQRLVAVVVAGYIGLLVLQGLFTFVLPMAGGAGS